ncbi:hypothetical protein D9M72_543190 [compost metagenome]
MLSLKCCHVIPEPRRKRVIVKQRWQIHAHVDNATGRRTGDIGPPCLNIGALADAAFHVATVPRFVVSTANGGKVDPQRFCQHALRRQSHPVRKPSIGNIRGNRIRDREIERPISLANGGAPRNLQAFVVHRYNIRS